MIVAIRTILLLLLCAATSLSLRADDARSFKVINAANGLADNSAQLVMCIPSGRMVIATQANLNFYDGSSFTHIDARQEQQFQLPLYDGSFRVYTEKEERLWLKTTHSVTCVDLHNEQFISDFDSVFVKVLGCHDSVKDLFCDESGRVWLLTDKGLYNTDNKKYYNVLKDRRLQDVAVYADKQLLLFYDNAEEVSVDIVTGNTLHRTRALDWNDAERYASTSFLLPYKNGYFQIRNGSEASVLLHFDVESQDWVTLRTFAYQLNSMVIEEGSELMYIPSEHGYWIYHLKDGTFDHEEEQRLYSGDRLHTRCNSMAFDKQGGLWIGTKAHGLLYARPADARFNVYGLSSPEAAPYLEKLNGLRQNITEIEGKEANCMFTDSREWTWIGTTKGLYLYRKESAEPMVFGRRQGLLNQVIHAVAEDKDQNIWLSTSYGISCIVFKGDKPVFINSFNHDDNVPLESFLNCKALCLDNGHIVMQAIDHVVEFDPRQFTSVNVSRPCHLSPQFIRLLVNGSFIRPGEIVDGNLVIDGAITQVRDISLTAEQNSASLTFSGLNYFRPIQTFYRVRVTGKGIPSNDWQVYSYYGSGGLVDSRGMLHLPLNNLLPGDYLIEVEASMFPDVWEDDVRSWVVHVSHPWWRTTGIYMILLLLLLIVMSVNFYFYGRNMKMRARRNNEEGDMIKKIRSFVDRCDASSSELQSPTQKEIYGDIDDRSQLSPDFIQIMLKLIPYVQDHKKGHLSMTRLSRVADVDIVRLYDVISADLYKSPRQLTKLFRLRRATAMLEETDKTIEEIADECGFYTPNYFIGNFFHQYKMTPDEYRKQKSTYHTS